MATQKQIEANRRNAKGSTGPRTPPGKAKTRLNGLKHGLRSAEVVLPTESREAFQEHLDAWMADWKPSTMARAQLVEDAAVAAWRKRRCVRVESARASKRVRDKLNYWHRAEQVELDLIVENLHDEPQDALTALLGSRAGVDRLIAMWGEVAEAAASPEGWFDPHEHHFRLIALHGRRPGDPEATVLRDLSWRLFLRNAPEDWIMDDEPEPWDDERAGAIAGVIRDLSAERIESLRLIRAELPDDSERLRQAEAHALEPRTEDAPLLRYEAQLSRQFHRSLADLVKLTQTGADLAEADEEPAEAIAPTEANSESEVVTETEDGSEETVDESVPAGVEIEADGPSGPSTVSARDRDGRVWPVSAARTGR